MEVLESIEYKGYTINIYPDDSYDSPREWDNLGVMVCFHNRYDLGDKNHNISKDDWFNDKSGEYEYCNSWDDIKHQIECKYGEIAVILPLGLYDHSGITMYVGNSHDRWDGGQVGFIFVTKEAVRKEYSVKRITKKLLEKVTKVLEGEVETYDQYLTGQVYGYQAVDDDDNVIDSCWGYYDDYKYSYIISEAKSAIDCHIDSVNKAKQVKTKQLIKAHVPLQYR